MSQTVMNRGQSKGLVKKTARRALKPKNDNVPASELGKGMKPGFVIYEDETKKSALLSRATKDVQVQTAESSKESSAMQTDLSCIGPDNDAFIRMFTVDYKERIDCLEREKAEMEISLKTLEMENSLLKSDTPESLKMENEKLREENSSLHTEVRRLEEQVQMFSEVMVEITEERDEITRKYEELYEQLNSSRDPTFVFGRESQEVDDLSSDNHTNEEPEGEEEKD